MTDATQFSFPHERLDAYQAALELDGEVRKVLAEVPRDNHLIDQLERASASISLNIAEGAGEYRPKEKARFYRIALRSTAECAAALDLLKPILAAKRVPLHPTRHVLARVSAMLTKLVKSQSRR